MKKRDDADDVGDDVVAKRQRKGEDRARDHARKGERQDHRAKGGERPGAEIRRGLDQPLGHPLEGRLGRQDHERQPDVGEHQEHAEVGDRQGRPADHRQRQHGIEQPGEPGPGERPADDALLGQDQLPGIDPDQIARPERQHDREVEQRLGPAGRVARHQVGDRKADQRGAQRDRERHADRAQDDVEVGTRGQKVSVGAERQLVDHLAGEVVEGEEALDQEREQRAQIDDAQPEQGRGQQEQGEQARAPVEQGREPAHRARRRQAGDRQAGHERAHGVASSCRRCIALGAQPRRMRAPTAGRAPPIASFGRSAISMPPPSSATSMRVLAP